MKGDLILLGITGMAILVIPLGIAMGSGVLPASGDRTMAASSANSVSAAAPPAQNWQTTPIPGGVPAAVEQSPLPEPEPESAQSTAAQPPDTGDKEKPAGTDADSYRTAVKSFRVLDRTTGKVNELPVRDYVRGAIAAEMPASFHLEALKAQGVAALTYALYHAEEQKKNPDPLLLGADFSADPSKREGYMTEKEAKKFYGENWQYNWDKVCTAAEEAQRWVVLAEGAPIAAAYHAISAGSTEAAENIWERPMPGLRSVDSSWDILARDYRSTVTLSQSEIKERLKETEVTLLPNADTWFEVEERSDAGYVTQVRVGNQTMTGNQLRNLLGLRSSSFQIERQGKAFLFRVSGYGHGAGLSQNGADYMARQGSDFSEILAHYYRDTLVTRLE